jgi:hypothetical protein
MKRRTFLQILGLTAAPIPALVGADLGKALTEVEEKDTALIRVSTSIKPVHFKIPVRFENNVGGGTTCYPIKKSIKFLAGEGMRIESIEVRTHPKLAEFYKSIGLERGWVGLPIKPVDITENGGVTIAFSESGLYTAC